MVVQYAFVSQMPQMHVQAFSRPKCYNTLIISLTPDASVPHDETGHGVKPTGEMLRKRELSTMTVLSTGISQQNVHPFVRDGSLTAVHGCGRMWRAKQYHALSELGMRGRCTARTTLRLVQTLRRGLKFEDDRWTALSVGSESLRRVDAVLLNSGESIVRHVSFLRFSCRRPESGRR